MSDTSAETPQDDADEALAEAERYEREHPPNEDEQQQGAS